jgi:hypothetical protein
MKIRNISKGMRAQHNPVKKYRISYLCARSLSGLLVVSVKLQFHAV